MEVMGCHVHAIGKDIRPPFADPVTNRIDHILGHYHELYWLKGSYTYVAYSVCVMFHQYHAVRGIMLCHL